MANKLALIEERPHPIVREMRRLGINRKELARRMGMSETSIGNYINRKVPLYPDDIKTIKLMKVLGITLNELKTY